MEEAALRSGCPAGAKMAPSPAAILAYTADISGRAVGDRAMAPAAAAAYREMTALPYGTAEAHRAGEGAEPDGPLRRPVLAPRSERPA